MRTFKVGSPRLVDAFLLCLYPGRDRIYADARQGAAPAPGAGVGAADNHFVRVARAQIYACPCGSSSPARLGLDWVSISRYGAAETLRDSRRPLWRAPGRPGRERELLPDLDPHLRLDHLLPRGYRDDGAHPGRRAAGLQLRPL